MNNMSDERQAFDLSIPLRVKINGEEVAALLRARTNWFRQESREHDRTKVDKREGDWVSFRQRIVRAGYWLSPMDMPEEAALARAYQMVALSANQYRAGVPSDRIIKGPNGYPGLGIDELVVRAVVKSLGPRSEMNILRGALWGVRNEWANEMRWQVGKKDPRIDLTLRTFYYEDLPEPLVGQVEHIRGKWIGRYHGGSPGSWGIESYCETEPPYLENWVYQQVYIVNVRGEPYLVHPLDIDPTEAPYAPFTPDDLP